MEKQDISHSQTRQMPHPPQVNNLMVAGQHSDNKITEEDFGATTLASSSRAELYSNAMSWRNKQMVVPQQIH
jgi:hypothetical protein